MTELLYDTIGTDTLATDSVSSTETPPAFYENMGFFQGDSLLHPEVKVGQSGLKVAVSVDSDDHKEDGIYVDYNGAHVYAVWNEKYQCYVAIRKLLPIECFRLQGFTNDYFWKAEFVNSDSQLYKQIGNSVTVPIVEEIAKRLTEGDYYQKAI